MSEPWLSGPIEGLDILLAPLFYTFRQTREELAEHTAGMTAEQLWASPHGMTPVGFHMRHIAGAIERLATYAKGAQLTADQLAELKAEGTPGAEREELLAAVEQAMAECEEFVRSIDTATLREPRGVGRKMLPTTLNGLLVHIGEHTFRHLGQAITTAKVVKSGQ